MVKRQLDVSNDIPNGHPEVSKYVFEDVDLYGENEEKNKNVSKENKESGPPPVSFLSLFQYASRRDKILIAIGCLAPLLSGGSMPAIVVLLGDLLDTFVLYSQNPKNDEIYKNSSNATPFSVFNMAEEDAIMQGFLSEIRKFGLGMALIGVIVLFLNYIMVTCLSVSAENQAFRIRHYFMKAVVRQDLAWFDTHQTGDFASRATTDLNRIQDGIGEKIGMCVFFMSTTIVSFVVALVYGWKLTLVILSVMPILVISGGVLAKVQATLSANELTAYGSAGAVAEEVLSSIRTVVAFGGERKEIERYEKNLVQARKNGIKRSLVTSIGASMVWLCIYGSYALAFWYGVKLIIESREAGNNEYVPSTLIIVFFNVLMGAMNMGQASPYLEAFAIARGAAGMIFEIIERIPLIDSSSETGEKPATLEGNVEFHNVHFSYPARPDVPVLQGLGFEVKSGETVALVGASGCGKSTVVQLIQRFYDPKEGQ
ncbi:multidrug resistance protein 1A-like, partial [Limulus polyphemus]|uniref:Multidrug resistance protein 1A-like n=1 Tax=Limulus polyphemus TaxID=6850 RepID=A0ABM1SA19_LIMPO